MLMGITIPMDITTKILRFVLATTFVVQAIDLQASGVVKGKAKEKHWAFQSVTEPPPPTVKNRGWVTNPIDAFILEKLEAKGLQPAPRHGRYHVDWTGGYQPGDGGRRRAREPAAGAVAAG